MCPNVNKYLYLTYTCTQTPKDIADNAVRLTPQEELEEDAVSRSTEPSGIIFHSLHKKWSFPLRISAVNVTKSAFGQIYWRNP